MYLKIEYNSELEELLEIIYDTPLDDGEIQIRLSLPLKSLEGTKTHEGIEIPIGASIQTPEIGRLLQYIIVEVLNQREIKTLHLDNFHLNTDILLNVSAALKSEKPLTLLRVGNNKIDDQGAKIIGDILKQGNIKEIELTGNNITNSGLQYIFEALANNNTLKKLHLSMNPIDSLEGIEKIANSALEYIDFDSCNIKELTPEVLNFLKTSKVLKLDVSNNELNLFNVVPKLHELYKNDLKTHIDLREQKNSAMSTENLCFLIELYQPSAVTAPQVMEILEALKGDDCITFIGNATEFEYNFEGE